MDKDACRNCVLCQGGQIRDPDGRFEIILEVPIAEPWLTRPYLCAIAEAECTAKADRVIFIPPFAPRDTGSGAQIEDYAAAYTRACRRLEAAGFSRRSPMEFARESAIRHERPRPLWRPVDRHIGIGLGANAQSHVNDWIFLNEPDLDRFDRSLSLGGLGIVYGTFLTAEERMRLGIIYDLLTRGVIDLDGFGAQHAIGAARPLLKDPARLNDLAARGIVTTGTGNAIEFAPHAILHTAEICGAFAYPPTPVRNR
jgi:coproporphyrinogen III oxidase-like Fe-S oxidoreductase